MRSLLLSGLVLLMAAPPAQAETWREIQTGPWTFVYEDRDEACVQLLAQMAPEVYETVTSRLGYRPERVTVVLRGRTDSANGFFTYQPERLDLFLALPESNLISASARSHLRSLLTHEFTHFVHLTNPIGFAGALKPWMGDAVQAVNQLFLPGWMVEGITTNSEGLDNGGGRLDNRFFEQEWKGPWQEVRLWGYEQAGYASYEMPAGRIYASGLFLVRHLLQNWGDQAFNSLWKDYTAWPLFGFDGSLQRITGLTPPEFYRQAVEQLSRAWQAEANLPRGQRLSPAGQGHWFVPRPTAKGLWAYSEPRTQPAGLHLLGSDLGRPWNDEPPKAPIRLDNDQDWSVSADGRWLAAAWQANSNQGQTPEDYTGTSRLWLRPTASGDWQPVTADTPQAPGQGGFLRPALSPDARLLAAVHRVGARAELLLGPLNPEAGRWGQTRSLIQADQLEYPNFSPDGQNLVVTAGFQGRQGLLVFSAHGDSWILSRRIAVQGGALYQGRWLDGGVLLAITDQAGRLDPVLISPEGQITRYPTDPTGTLAAAVDSDRLLYSSRRSDGTLVFAAGPDWKSGGQALPQAPDGWDRLPALVPAAPLPSRPHLDVPLPTGWLPLGRVVASGSTVLAGAGAVVQGLSYLETRAWNLWALAYPQVSLNSFGASWAGREDGFQGQLSVQGLTAQGWWQGQAVAALALPLAELRTPGLTGDVTAQATAGYLAASLSPQLHQQLSGSLDLDAKLVPSNPPLRAFLGSSWLAGRASLTLLPAWLSLTQNQTDLETSLGGGLSLPFQALLSAKSWLYQTTGPNLQAAPRGRTAGSDTAGNTRLHTAVDLALPLGLADVYVLGTAWIRQGLTLWLETGWQGQTSTWFQLDRLHLDPDFYLGAEFNTAFVLGGLRTPLYAGASLRRSFARPDAPVDPRTDLALTVGLRFGSRPTSQNPLDRPHTASPEFSLYSPVNLP